MIVNNTCVPGNGTDHCLPPSSPAGLAVGLTLFFLLLVILAAVIAYKYQSKIRNMMQFGKKRSQEKGDSTETPRADPDHYSTLVRQESVEQTPIYENLAAKTTGYHRPANPGRSDGESEENLYLQCGSLDDGIYCNDSTHEALQDSQEDVYVVPD